MIRRAGAEPGRAYLYLQFGFPRVRPKQSRLSELDQSTFQSQALENWFCWVQLVAASYYPGKHDPSH